MSKIFEYECKDEKWKDWLDDEWPIDGFVVGGEYFNGLNTFKRSPFIITC